MSTAHQIAAFSAVAPSNRVPSGAAVPDRSVAPPPATFNVPPQIDGFSSAEVMLRALYLRRISVVELITLQLRRIRHYDPSLQVFSRLADDAVGRARAADKVRRTGYRSMLTGLPLTLEETAQFKMPTLPPGRLARKVGATVIGHTRHLLPNTAESQGPAARQTRNPWDSAHSAGAGTSAAAVAAGLSPLAFGNDGLGELRRAAAYCGVFAHRPSQPVARQSVPSRGGGRALFGVVSRSAEDLKLGARLLGTADGSGAAGWWLQAAERHTELAAFRVAVLPILEESATHPEVADAFAAFVADLRHHGATVRVLPTPLGQALSRQVDSAPGQERAGGPARQHLLTDLFRNWDVVLTPATAGLAPRHGDPSPAWHVHDPTLASIASSSNHPVTAFPIALSRQMLPIAAQVIGPYLEDRTPIHFAALSQDAFGGYHRAPGYSGVS